MSNVSDPARFAVAVVPSDVTVLSPTRGLWIGTAGSVEVRMFEKQNIVTFANVPVGMLPIQVDQVRAATGALDIVAVF